MRKLNRILALLFMFALVLSMTAFAADEGTFNASVTIDTSVADQITVTIPASNDTVLKNQKPTLRINCDFEKAYVKFGETVLSSDKYELDTEAATIEFEVAAAGSYLIIKGDAPVVTPTPTPTPAPTPTPGELEDVTPETNFGKAKLSNSEAELKAAVPLTEEEQKAVENGVDVEIWLEVTDISKTVSAADKNLISKQLGGCTVGKYLDISLFKQVGDDAASKLSELNKKVTITLTLPDSLINKDPNLFRSYRIVRVHEGVAKIITPVFNEKAKTLTFETDCFSTYAIVYKDTDVPQTGDTTNGALWGALTLVSAAAFVTTVAVARRKAEES